MDQESKKPQPPIIHVPPKNNTKKQILIILGIILLVTQFILLGIQKFHSSAIHWSPDFNKDNNFDFNHIIGMKSTDVLIVNEVYADEKIKNINIVHGVGEVKIEPSEDNQIHLSISSTSLDYKDNVTISTKGNSLNISAKRSTNHNDENYNIELLIPSSIAVVTGKTNVGDITIENICVDQLDYSLNTGDVSVDNIKGDTTLEVNIGSVDASKMTGKIDIEVNTGDATLEMHDIIDDIKMNLSVGSLVLDMGSDAKGTIHAKTSIGSISAPSSFSNITKKRNITTEKLSAVLSSDPIYINLEVATGDISIR